MSGSELSSNTKVSVVCGDHGRAQHICNILFEQKLDATSGDFTSPCDVFLFDLTTCRPSLVSEVVNYATEYKGSRPLIATLGQFSCNSEIPSQVDVRLSSDTALHLAHSRFHFAKRTAARRAEVELRRDSYAKFGLHTPPEAKHKNRDILYVGEASPRFLSLKDHLESQGFSLTASFSSYTAFDYLHEHSFGAILLDTAADAVRPDNFCAMVRRSSNLAEIPLLAITESSFGIGEDILKCATDLIDEVSSLHSISEQLLELVVNRGPSAKEFAAPNEAITDAVTGLFTRSFFEDHLDRQIEWSLDYDQPLTLLIIKVISGSDNDTDPRDLAYTARVLNTLLRIQDAPTKLDSSTLAVSMPNADEQGATYAARRIEGVLDATAFESEPGKPARQVLINWQVSELNPDQTPEQLLSTALQKGHVAA